MGDTVIHRLQERFHATGRATERPRSGRPRCTSRQDWRSFPASTTLKRQLMNAVHVNVSASTIRSRLHEAGRSELKERSSQTSLDSGSLPRPCICAGRGSSDPLLPSTTAGDASGAGSESASFEARFGRYGGYGGGSVMVWGGIHLNENTPLRH